MPIRLSIITINLNNAVGLKKTIESVINQTSKDFEYIVIDGGSTDGSVEIIQQYKDRINYWVSEPDKGIYAAMNKGIRVAKGEYCQFLNSGDWLWKDDVTERMLKDLPQCSIIYGNEVRDNQGVAVVEKSYAGRTITLLDLYLSTIVHSSAYIKKSLFEKYGYYDEHYRIVSDWKFYLITVGLNGESVAYRDINVSWFDMTGISSSQKQLDAQERAAVLQTTIPNSIRSDYEKFGINSIILQRLQKNKAAWFVTLNLYRLLFRFDKLVNSIVNKYIVSEVS